MSPAELWILNPRKLITHLEPEPKSSETDGDAKVDFGPSKIISNHCSPSILNYSQALAPEKRKLLSTNKIVGFVTIRRKTTPLFNPVNARVTYRAYTMSVSSGG